MEQEKDEDKLEIRFEISIGDSFEHVKGADWEVELQKLQHGDYNIVNGSVENQHVEENLDCSDGCSSSVATFNADEFVKNGDILINYFEGESGKSYDVRLKLEED